MGNKPVKAFILAAGLGTRLKPLTDSIPKALVLYKNKPMIENVIQKLSRSGINDIIINTHHFSDVMEKYFRNRIGKENITLIHEKEILGTGGAIKNAEKYLENSENFIVYNTDVECDVSVNTVIDAHRQSGAMVTLCVQNRKTSRYLLTGMNGNLIGRTENKEEKIYSANHDKSEKYDYKAFCGIHIINSNIFQYFGSFSYPFDIIPFYMYLVSLGKLLDTFDLSGVYWKDLGIPQNL